MKTSISQHIINYLSEQRDFVLKGKIFDYVKQQKFSYDESIGRRCRLLEEKGKIESKIEKGLVYYRIKEEKKEKKIEEQKIIIQRSLLEFNYANDEK